MAHNPYLRLLRDRELLGSMLRRIVADAESQRERGGEVCFDLDAARDVMERVGHLTGVEHFTRPKGGEPS